MEIIDPTRSNAYIVMFDGATNVKIGSDLLKYNDQKLTVMHGFEHTVSFFPVVFPKLQCLPK